MGFILSMTSALCQTFPAEILRALSGSADEAVPRVRCELPFFGGEPDSRRMGVEQP
jgi:hypothetical protein